MQLGNFSVSLAVSDLKESRAFYQKLGFTIFHGDEAQGWLILKNGDCTIGLFQNMIDRNILTFNPGWNAKAEQLDEFQDVRELQRELRAQGISFDREADETSSGAASFEISDPDGNKLLFDQHV